MQNLLFYYFFWTNKIILFCIITCTVQTSVETTHNFNSSFCVMPFLYENFCYMLWLSKRILIMNILPWQKQTKKKLYKLTTYKKNKKKRMKEIHYRQSENQKENITI